MSLPPRTALQPYVEQTYRSAFAAREEKMLGWLATAKVRSSMDRFLAQAIQDAVTRGVTDAIDRGTNRVSVLVNLAELAGKVLQSQPALAQHFSVPEIVHAMTIVLEDAQYLVEGQQLRVEIDVQDDEGEEEDAIDDTPSEEDLTVLQHGVRDLVSEIYRGRHDARLPHLLRGERERVDGARRVVLQAILARDAEARLGGTPALPPPSASEGPTG